MKQHPLTTITLWIRRYALAPAGIGLFILLTDHVPLPVLPFFAFTVPILAAIGFVNEIVAVIHLWWHFDLVPVQIMEQNESTNNKVTVKHYHMKYDYHGREYVLQYGDASPFSSGVPSHLLISKANPMSVMIDSKGQKYLSLLATGGLLYFICTIPAVHDCWLHLFASIGFVH